MKTLKHKNLIRVACILLIVLTGVSSVEAYPPDNAAVLYYRAFIVVKEPSEDNQEMFKALREGKIKSNDEIKQCLEENRRAIELIETAADIPNCDWGRDESKGFDLLLPELGKIRLMAFLLTADAQVLAENSEYRAALNKCLVLHKMARHVGDDLLISYLVGISLNTLANKRVQDFLSEMPQDMETITWLKNQLVEISSQAILLKTAMRREKEIAIHEIRKEKIDTILEALGDDALKDSATAEAVQKARKGDEEFFKNNRQYYANIMTEVIKMLDLSYVQSHKQLTELNERIQKEAKENSAAILTALLTPPSTRIFSTGTKNTTFFNAIEAAINIYIVRAKTGRLPEKLPPGLPRDLFSGKDFEYKRTRDGFVLHCQGRDLDKNEAYQYNFGVSG